jgi:hypothetical protein
MDSKKMRPVMTLEGQRSMRRANLSEADSECFSGKPDNGARQERFDGHDVSQASVSAQR